MNNCIISIKKIFKNKINNKTVEELKEIYKTRANIASIKATEKIELYNIYSKNVIAFNTRKCNLMEEISLDTTKYKIKYKGNIYKILDIDLTKYNMYVIIRCVKE